MDASATIEALPRTTVTTASSANVPGPLGPGPLAGLRVVDCSTVLAGPYCTMLLGDLGADVVKVEPPEGDATRGWGPPWVGSEADGTRTAAYYLAINRNKRSVRLDLRKPEGATVLRRLLVDADVLIENARPGSFARLGFDDDALAAINPALVHLAISGYGTDGPAADRPGYDFVVQAASGLMSITGAADADGGAPTKVGVAISDVVTGMLGAVSVLAGLLARGSGAGGSAPGAGQRIDISLLGATLATLVNQAQNAFVTGVAPGRRGNAHPNIVPYETFATADGEIAVAVGSERQWPRFCEALGLASWPPTRGSRRTAIGSNVAPSFGPSSRPDSSSATRRAGWRRSRPPRCRAVRSATSSRPSHPPEAVARGMTVEMDHPAFGVIRQVGIPFEFAATPASIRVPPPLLGQDTDAVLAELGYSPAEIESLRADAVI